MSSTQPPRAQYVQIKEYQRYIELVAGTVVGVMGFQMFTVPLGFYNGGTVGVAQIIRTLIVDYLGITPSFDFSGVLNLLFNVPLMILAYRSLSPKFFFRTLLCVIVQTLTVSLIQLSEPIITDPLTACLVGGILGGGGVGIILRAGGSTAGFDILGMWFAKNKSALGVGTLINLMNAGVYIVCALLFDVRTAIYSLIFAFVCALVIDRVHTQSVNCGVFIFTSNEKIPQLIVESVKRGATVWKGFGAHSGSDKYVCFTVVSKFEEVILRKAVESEDPGAFIVVSEHLRVYGNFIRRLT